jgi:anti-anti-sigma factor
VRRTSTEWIGDDVDEMSASSTGSREPLPAPGSITIEFEGAERVLRLVGEIDVAVVQAFEAAGTARPGTVDAIDAGAVTFIDAAGVGLVLRWRLESEARGRPVVLRRSSRPVDRLLALAGIHFPSGS